MKIFVCHATPANYTLISYTDRYIYEAVKTLVPNAVDCYLNQKDGGYQEHLDDMRNAYLSEIPMLTIDTVGKIPFHKSPKPLERNRLSYFSDAPYSNKFINDIPAGQTVTYSDRNFKEFYEDINFQLNYIFMPHGGPNNILDTKPIKERDETISFVGRIRNPSPATGFEKLLVGSDPKIISIFKNASQLALHEGEDIYIAYKKSCLNEGVQPLMLLPLTTLQEILTALYSWVEDQKRVSVLREFKNYPLNIYGPVSGDVKGVTDRKHKFHGLMTGSKVLEILKNTRVLLNSVGVFSKGSHERIWFSIASGCMPFTDPSSFIEETYAQDESILTIDYNNIADSIAKTIHYSETPDLLQPIVDRAKDIYMKNHTWLKRFESTFKEMNII